MPWKVSDVAKERAEFVQQWESGEWNLAELCREYGITRKTGYKWLERYELGGPGMLGDQSRAPHRHPNQTSEAMEKAILELRAKRPLWGARKIWKLLEKEEGAEQRPAISTIGAILKQHKLTAPRKRRARAEPSQQPLAHAGSANAVWCADFKGWFRTGDGKRCDPLTITDAYSRYLLRCQAVAVADTTHVRAVFEGAFREDGLPQRIRTDNGAPFGSNGRGGLTALAVWWMRLGIEPERIRPGQPQENGRHERMHLTLKQSTAMPPAATLRSQQRRFDEFVEEYNQERPHEALGLTTPAEHYQPSVRPYPKHLPAPEYPASWEVRRVSLGGKFRWWSGHVFLSHALVDQSIGLQRLGMQQDRYWRVYFMSFVMGVVDSHTRKLWTPEQWLKRESAAQERSGTGQ